MDYKEFMKIERKRAAAIEESNAAFLEFITWIASRLKRKCYGTPIVNGNYAYAVANDEHLDNRLVVVCCNVADYMQRGMSAMFPIYNPHAENDDYGWDRENSITIYSILYEQVIKTPMYCYRTIGTRNRLYVKD